MEKIAFLGCSRGLGRATLLAWNKEDSLYAFSRKTESLKAIKEDLIKDLTIEAVDFSKVDQLENLVQNLENLKLDRLFYFAAGGPYGNYRDKEWKDHQWALQVSFLTPAFLLHRLSHIKQMVFIGSAIADDQADSLASSYAAAKHGLRGLVTSLIAEKDPRDIRLVRPGYMDTEMLPPQARPRREGQNILSPQSVAEKVVEWAQIPDAEPILTLDS